MLKVINEWSGIIAAVCIALWFILPGKRLKSRPFRYSPIPPSAGNALHDGLGIAFGIS